MNANPYIVALKQLLQAIKHLISVMLTLPGLMLTDKVAEVINLPDSPVTHAKIQILTVAFSSVVWFLGYRLIAYLGFLKEDPYLRAVGTVVGYGLIGTFVVLTVLQWLQTDETVEE